jgi:hypothetical protein
VQSQDVQPSAWSVAQRTLDGTEAAVERARADGRLLRTHVLRTTWHDVAGQDLRWLLRLTGPRVLASTRGVRRELALDDDLLGTARRAVEAALTARGALPRAELRTVLAAEGLELDGRALGHVLMHLELTGLLCSGPRQGARQTSALLDERVPPAPELDHDAAVAELVRRFLAGHGPAAVQDLAWWSSLLVSDVRAALAALGDAVVRDVVDGLELWSAADAPRGVRDTGVLLVQLYDEHLVAFTARSTWPTPGERRRTAPGRTPGWCCATASWPAPGAVGPVRRGSPCTSSRPPPRSGGAGRTGRGVRQRSWGCRPGSSWVDHRRRGTCSSHRPEELPWPPTTALPTTSCTTW